MVGELRLYVNPDGLKQNCRLAGSTGAKPQDMSSSSSEAGSSNGLAERASVSATNDPVERMAVGSECGRGQQDSRFHELLGGSQDVADHTTHLSDS